MPRPERETPDLFAAAPLPVAPLDDTQRLACLRLIRSENVGPATFRALINHYGGATRALEALPEIARRAGRGRPVRVCPAAEAQAELEMARRAGVSLLFTIEPGYPAPLAFLDGAPPLIYVKGRTELLARRIVGVVGSREASAAGQKLARQLAGELGAAGVVVASGLARGIDVAAHEASLATGTIAILAGGIDVVYPREHTILQHRIGSEGCLVSEMPMGFQPRGQDFPRRNRIISGVSEGVVVVEAARRSGSLITARLAGEQGREVFAVPGHPLDPRAEGTNRLIKDGATLVTCGGDVLAALAEREGWRERLAAMAEADKPGDGAALGAPAEGAVPAAEPAAAPADAHARVIAALGPAPVNVDEIARATRLPIRDVQVALLELALAGRIEQHGSHLVSLKP